LTTLEFVSGVAVFGIIFSFVLGFLGFALLYVFYMHHRLATEDDLDIEETASSTEAFILITAERDMISSRFLY
jgi:hypothetical protein